MLENLLKMKECEYLDFKYEIYDIFHSDNDHKLQERQEFLRDVLSLINIKRLDYYSPESFLIIGVKEENEEYNGIHTYIKFTKFQTFIQLIQEYIEPSLTIEFEVFFLSGDKYNILVSKTQIPNYDRIILIKFIRQIGEVYEIKKQIGNDTIGFLDIGDSYTRDGSLKRRIKEIERKIVREHSDVRFNVKFINQKNEMNITKKLKRIYSKEEMENKLKNIHDSLMIEQNSTLSDKDIEQNDNQLKNFKGLIGLIKVAKLFTDNLIKPVSNEDLERYNNNVDTYINILRNYIIDRNLYFTEFNEIIKLNIIILNLGAIKAKDIDIYINLPEIYEFIEKIPEPPEKPIKPPQKPTPSFLGMTRDVLDYISGASQFGPIFNNFLPSISSINLPQSNYNTIINKHELKIHIEDLKQGYVFTPNNIFIRLPSNTNPLELHLSYKIIVGEPSKDFQGNLRLNINFN